MRQYASVVFQLTYYITLFIAKELKNSDGTLKRLSFMSQV